ncbi:matrix metalloproteinase-17-like [Patiria miniata]|uniref:Peptidase metallopeptidase domain-containing protein n=1 Tax=Patiria miniata TaxID=46514 RepID=A0A913ZY59_PATMI|nr:matrix metalloproteinase-17-like [Patiria miniata]
MLTSTSEKLRWVFLLVCCAALVTGFPSISDDPEVAETTFNFLTRYGYLNTPASEEADIATITDVQSAIRRVQYYANLPETGTVDDDTLRAMKMPRCGVPDPTGRSVNGTVLGGRLRRYAHTGGRWHKRDLTYRILNNPPELSFSEVTNTIREAFKVWSDITPLSFHEITGANYADIYLKFAPYDHGDPFPFDGPGGTLAHAYPPLSGFNDLDGDVHFDDSEMFTIDTYDGTNLLQVAAHEIGHSLGLSHSAVQGALMQPFFPGYDPNFKLHYDDILGIQTIYGSGGPQPGPNPDPTYRPIPDQTQAPVTVPRPNKDTCNKAFTAMAYIRGEIFGFRGARYWRIAREGQLISHPEGDKNKYFWVGLPAKIDAGYERWHDQKSLFFKGNQYWQFDGITLQEGFPRYISDLSPDLPTDIDAVMTWKEFSKTYFFKGNMVWRFDEVSQTVDANWPYRTKDIFPGVPSSLGSAFRFRDGNGYFIRGRKYWRYNDTSKSVDPGFPRYFGSDFLNCNLEEILEEEAREGANGAGGIKGALSVLGLTMALLLSL